MPFKSEKQRRFMFARHPEIAKRWTRKYGSRIQKRSRGGLVRSRVKAGPRIT